MKLFRFGALGEERPGVLLPDSTPLRYRVRSTPAVNVAAMNVHWFRLPAVNADAAATLAPPSV